MNLKHLTASMLCLGLVPAVHAADNNTKDSVSQITASDFALQDFRGKRHHLSDYKDAKLIVLTFLGTECPLVKLYGPRLQELSQRYQSDGVVFLGVNSNRQDSLADIAAYARRHKVTFPILKDVRNKVADQLQAKRTPGVVVLNAARQPVYQGRIDDQYGIGYARETPQNTYLADAIDASLANRTPKVTAVPAEGCLIGRVRKVDDDSKVTYGSHIASILSKHCVQCHQNDEIAPFALTSFDEVAGWAEMIREVVRDERMPPWHASAAHGKFSNTRRLTDEDKTLIDQWVLAGAPAGDLSSLPALPKKTEGWQLKTKPDVVVSMNKTYSVPAAGTVEYQYFEVDPQFKEDRWIRAAEVVPGARDVVHHILVFARDKNAKRGALASGGGAFLAAYVPGLRAAQYPDGMAKMVPAGSTLVFQMHYTPNGEERDDRSSIGFYFADEDEISDVVVTQQAINRRFAIPPQDNNFRVASRSRRSPVDLKVLSLMPHMHLRGKSFRYEAVMPGGKRETLLDVPAYDFNWQTSYNFETPVSLPKGAHMRCVAHFDNSENNLNNPNPEDTVRWGEQTWNEMMIGYFDIAMPRRNRNGESSELKAVMNQYDKDGDGRIQRAEVPQNLNHIFVQLDVDKNDEVTFKELKKMATLR